MFAAARQRGPVQRVTLGDGHGAWVIVSYDLAREALNDPRFSKNMQAAFSSGTDVAEGLPGPALAKHMLAVDPPDHTRLRRLVSSAFTPRRVETLRPRVEAIVGGLLDGLAASGPDEPVDLVSSFAFPLPFTVICELLGVDAEDRAELGHELTTLLSPTPTDEAWARAKQASDAVIGMLTALVEQKHASPTDDLVSGLIEARDEEGKLDHQELLATIFQLIVAGHDTTTSLIGNGVVALLAHPDQLAAFRADESATDAAVEELLRFDAPVPHATFRFAATDVEIGGVTIPKGDQVLVSLAAANRDSAHFSSPDQLDLSRQGERHLAFGHGIHFCLGAPLARMEGRIALRSLFERFPGMQLAVAPDELHWGHGDGVVLRGLSELPVRLGSDALGERESGRGEHS
ncbi:MAG TPA: cytochrome P450 [Acidimicrobiales bacterium]|nr:cytochrome P450 [Acidimicrobiales bacterium]